jgi:phosphomevalonate kinase
MSACYPALRYRAPGKLVLVGDYAVLDGAPAIVTAVDRGVECRAIPGFGARTVECPGDPEFVAAALAAVHAPGGHYVFTDWNPASTSTKAGFGGSASATVAAVLAGRSATGQVSSAEELFAIAAKVHRMVQGSGSGIDVAAAAHGGTLRFEAGTVAPIAAVRPAVVWSGASAATHPRITAYHAWKDRAAFVHDSAAIVDGFGADPIAAMNEARELLAGMADRAGIAWATPALDRIALLAELHGGAAKPSGAGGGDCAVALFPDPARESAFLAACASEGFLPIPVAVASGARALAPEES